MVFNSTQSKAHAFELTICGRVQGVGFRYFVYKTALQLGTIQGWVQNCFDGTVKVYCQSNSVEDLQCFIEACSRGPVLSEVSKMEKNTVPALDYQSFSIY